MKKALTLTLAILFLTITLIPTSFAGRTEKTTYEGRTAWIYYYKSAPKWMSWLRKWDKRVRVRFSDGTGYDIFIYPNGKKVKFFLSQNGTDGGTPSGGGGSPSGGPGHGGTY
ncbi:hypothetical protein HNV12_00745 [Methanococcoides sp. SA1]|nr:hypothetical protein [Methanococcoides sp. SA1]